MMMKLQQRWRHLGQFWRHAPGQCLSMSVGLSMSLMAATGLAHAGEIADVVAADYAYLGPLFEHFHAHPELSYVEHRTAARLAEELRGAGAEVTEGVGGTGVVALLRNGAGPVVMVRADMDGLPIEENSGLAYASKARQKDINGVEFPVMHACGHDVHITSLVGVARYLGQRRERWSGTLMLIGQPAEERIGGARKMLDDGLYTRFPRPDYALALHVSSQLETGYLRLDPGLAFSSSDSLDLIVPGIGTHGAAPHLGRDPIVIAAQIVVALQTLVAREISPLSPGVVTVGSFHAGTKHNIISDQAKLELTVRSDDPAVRDTLLKGIARIAENIGRAAGLPEDRLPRLSDPIASTPPTVNDAALSTRVRGALIEHFGAERMVDAPRIGMGAEDFAYFLSVEPPVPGAYFRVGGTPGAVFDAAAAGGPPVPGHHSALFRIAPREAILQGVEAMSVAVLELMGVPAAD